MKNQTEEICKIAVRKNGWALEFVKNQWKSNRSRFVNNIDFVKDKMYNFYRSRATTSFEQIKNEHNL